MIALKFIAKGLPRVFTPVLIPIEKTLEFSVQWLHLIDPHEETSLQNAASQDVWRFANICALLEYELSDLLSFYLVGRITENLLTDTETSFFTTLLKDEPLSRSRMREKLFVSMFSTFMEANVSNNGIVMRTVLNFGSINMRSLPITILSNKFVCLQSWTTSKIQSILCIWFIWFSSILKCFDRSYWFANY